MKHDLKQLRKKHDKKWDDLYLKIELFYNNCYYQSDEPTIRCKLVGQKTRPETDKEYEKRCENKQQNNKKEENPIWPTAMHGGNGLDG